jgi:hypothetical protein
MLHETTFTCINISENRRRRKRRMAKMIGRGHAQNSGKRAWQKMTGREHGTKWREEGMVKNGGTRAWKNAHCHFRAQGPSLPISNGPRNE